MSKPIYNPNKPYEGDINDLLIEDEIQKGKALPIGTHRTWGGHDYVKHADGWVHVSSGKLTTGKDMKHVDGHTNAAGHAEHAKKFNEERSKNQGGASKEAPAEKKTEAKTEETPKAKKQPSQGMKYKESPEGKSATAQQKVANKKLAEKLKDQPMHKDLASIRNESQAKQFVSDKLGISPTGRYGEAGLNMYTNSSGEVTELSIDIDRYSRHDHGGPDGDGWMGTSEINREYEAGVKQHKGKLDKVKARLEDMGIDADVDFSLGEKGHFTLDVRFKSASSAQAKLKDISKEELQAIKVTTPSGKEFVGVERVGNTYLVSDKDGRQFRLDEGTKYKYEVDDSDTGKNSGQSEAKPKADHQANAKQITEALGKPAEVFSGKDGSRISIAVDARMWNESQIKGRLSKEILEAYDVKTQEKVVNGKKSIHVDLVPKKS